MNLKAEHCDSSPPMLNPKPRTIIKKPGLLESKT